jgi:hypothetical protein
MLSLTITQISHFGDMAVPDYAAKTWQVWIIHEDDTTVIPTPNQLSLFGFEPFFTEYAISHGMNVNENGI